MKLVAIVGSNSDFSYNRRLLQYIKNNFSYLFDVEIIEIKDIPLFDEDEAYYGNALVTELREKIKEADGVIISTPEHNRTLPSSLKSFLEWCSMDDLPFQDKPVLVLGASYFEQGAARAQQHLRQILNAPGLKALVMPGDEFLLGNVQSAFDDKGELVDGPTVALLGKTLVRFRSFVAFAKKIDGDY